MEKPINSLVPLAVQYQSLLSLLRSNSIFLSEDLPENWSPLSVMVNVALEAILQLLEGWEKEIQSSNEHQSVSAIDILQTLDYAGSLCINELRKAFYGIANGFVRLRAMHDNLEDHVRFDTRGEIQAYLAGTEMLGKLVKPIRAEYKRLSQNQDYSGLAAQESVVLCLDAGGVRSLSSLLILRELMAKVTKIIEEGSSGTDPLISHEIARPRDYFDYIFASGRVGCIAVMLGQNILPVKESLLEFRRYANFANYATFAADKEESTTVEFFRRSASWFLEEHSLGLTAKFLYDTPSQVPDKCRTGFVAVSVKEGRKAHIFRSYAQKPPVDGSIEDGSLDYPNPSVEAFREVNRMYKAYHQDTYPNIQSKGEHQGTRSGVTFFLSIGVGNSAMIPSGLEDHEKGYREDLSSLTESSHEKMLQITDEKGPYRDTVYHRLDVRSKDIWGIDPDEKEVGGNGEKTLEMIEAVTEKYLAQADVDEELHKLAGHLVRLRCKRPRVRLSPSTGSDN